jgi:hypothetical protein
VHRLLGKIKITEQADQSCQDSSRLHAIKGIEQFAYLLTYLLGGRFGRDKLGHDDDISKPATANQSGGRDGSFLISTSSPQRHRVTENPRAIKPEGMGLS